MNKICALTKKLVVFIVFVILSVAAAQAATFTVTKTADTDDGACNADCSLREAFSAATASGSGVLHRIEFSAFFDTPRTIALTQIIYNDFALQVEIIGRGNHNVTLTTAAGNIGGLFRLGIESARFYNLRFANAVKTDSFQDGGAAINAIGKGNPLVIENCVFENNMTNREGGAIHVRGISLTVKDSTFRNNESVEGGGAISSRFGVAISNSTFTGNQAPLGAAILSESFGSTIANSTFSANHSTTNPFGSGNNIIFAYGILNLTNVTVAGNTGAASGAAVEAQLFAEINLTNSIVSQNPLGNLINVTQTGPNLIGGSPLLGTLAFNGGETETHALLAGSPAIDAGNSVLTIDQRGALRPQNGNPDLGAFESGVAVTSANTPTGSNVNATLGAVSITFSGVTQAGTTTQIPISPSGTPPGGYSFGAGFPAFQISTTAIYTPPVTICLQVPISTPPATFNALEILHFENGSWIPLSPTTRDSINYIICAPTNSLSPFAVAQNLAPTAANVSVSGRVLSEKGGLARARIVLTDANGNVRTATSNSFGYYRFDGVPVGQTIVVEARAKGFQFSPRIISLEDDLVDVDFMALP